VGEPQQTLDAAASCAAPRLRVLVFTTVFPNPMQPLHGTFVFERIRHLASLADVRVVAPIPWHHALRAPMPMPQTMSGLTVRYPVFWYLPKTLWSLRAVFLFLSSVPQIKQLNDAQEFDLIDAHFAYPDGFAAVLLGLWFRRPVCITLRGTIVQWSKRRLGRFLCDWAIRRAARVIAVAESLAERARQGGVREDRLVTIRNGVDAAQFRLMDREAARRSLDLPEGRRLLVSVGHISPRKGFQRVLRSLPRVVRSCPDICFAIVGGRGAEEDNSAELDLLVRRFDLTSQVIFAGAKPPDAVALWLAAADVFVLASDFEGCPNVVLEAMSCGRPVVASKVGDIERMVPNFAGILVDDAEDDTALADALLEALRQQWDPARIREHVAARSWDAVAEQVHAQWRHAVRRSTPAAGAVASVISQPPAASPASDRPISKAPRSVPGTR